MDEESTAYSSASRKPKFNFFNNKSVIKGYGRERWMWKESLKQGAIATEPKPDPDLNTDYCKSVPARQTTQVKRDHVYFKKFLLICLILEGRVIIF